MRAMPSSARHPLDDLVDNPIAQGQFMLGVMKVLKQAGWSFPMVEGFFDSIIPVEHFFAKEAALMQKIADEATLAGLPGVTADGAAQLPHVPSMPWYQRAGAAMDAPVSASEKAMVPVNKFTGGTNRLFSEITSLGGLFPNSVSDNLRATADEYWNASNVGQMADAGVGKHIAQGVLDMPPEQLKSLQVTNPDIFGGFKVDSPEFKDYLQGMTQDPNKSKALHDMIARSQHLGSTAAGSAAIQNPELAGSVNNAAADVESGKITGAEAAGNIASGPAKKVLDGVMPGNEVPQEAVSDMISGKQTVGGYVGNNWAPMLAQQVKQHTGWDVDPSTLQNWLPGVGIGLTGMLGSKMLGADWTTAAGIGLGGGLLGGNIYQAAQTGRSWGDQAKHVGGYLQGLGKQYVQPLFSPAQTPDQNAAVQTPGAAGTPGAQPQTAQPQAAPQTNAQAPTASGAPAQAQPLAPSAQTAQNTQQQAQTVGQTAAAQKPAQPMASPVAPTTPIVGK